MTESIYEESAAQSNADSVASGKKTEPSEFTFSAADKKVTLLLVNLKNKSKM